MKNTMYTHGLCCCFFLSLTYSEPTTPLKQLVTITKLKWSILSACLSQPFSSIWYRWLTCPPSWNTFFTCLSGYHSLTTLLTLLAAPLPTPSKASSPTLDLSPGPLSIYTHYLEDLILSHSFNYANSDKPRSHVSNLASSLAPNPLSNRYSTPPLAYLWSISKFNKWCFSSSNLHLLKSTSYSDQKHLCHP